MPSPADAWPILDYNEPVATTLQLWTQVVGKIRLARAPMVNHWWQVALYLTSTGLTTSLIPDGRRAFQIDFDFQEPALRVATTDGQAVSFPLEPMSVATFYRQTLDALAKLNIDAAPALARPVEVAQAIPFAEDQTHDAFDADWARRFWQALVQSERVFQAFRGRFQGKVSPVHFFWGAADLAVTRFSGRPAPQHPGGAPNCADWVMHEAYSHEVSSAGFWPGGGLGEPAYYSYAYPAPSGFADSPVQPDSAYYHEDMGEFVLTYRDVRQADDPDAALLAFLQSTYDTAADRGAWDRQTLER